MRLLSLITYQQIFMVVIQHIAFTERRLQISTDSVVQRITERSFVSSYPLSSRCLENLFLNALRECDTFLNCFEKAFFS